MPEMLKGSLFKLVVVMLLATTLLDFLHLEYDGIRFYSPVPYGGPAVLPAWFPDLSTADPEDYYGGLPWNLLLYIFPRGAIFVYIMVIARIDGSCLSGDGCSERVQNILLWFLIGLSLTMATMSVSDAANTCFSDFLILSAHLVYQHGSAKLCIFDDSDPSVSNIKDAARPIADRLDPFISDATGTDTISGEREWSGTPHAGNQIGVISIIQAIVHTIGFVVSIIWNVPVAMVIFLLPLLAIPRFRSAIKNMLIRLLIHLGKILLNKLAIGAIFLALLVILPDYISNVWGA